MFKDLKQRPCTAIAGQFAHTLSVLFGDLLVAFDGGAVVVCLSSLLIGTLSYDHADAKDDVWKEEK